MNLATKTPPRRLSIRHLMLAVLVSAIALFPIAEMTRQRNLEGVPLVIGVDLVAIPVVLVVWNNKHRRDRWRHLRNQIAIWTGMIAGYVALIAWLLHSVGRF
jgi:hypothetical protein